MENPVHALRITRFNRKEPFSLDELVLSDGAKQWLRFIFAETDEEMQEIAKGNPVLEEVYQEMREFSQLDWVQEYFEKQKDKEALI